VTWPNADDLHRTAKQLVDSGRAANQSSAEAMLSRFVMQIDVGAQVAQSAALQAALLTAVNAGGRAFLGGVNVRAEQDCTLQTPWAKGLRLPDAVTAFGGCMVSDVDRDHPTLVIGEPQRASSGTVVLQVSVSGWAGAILEGRRDQGDHDGIPIAGVVAAGLGVSEAFQHCLGDIEAGRRDVGLSLWQPAEPWSSQAAIGPPLTYLPSALWLLGLGHLGQGYAWSLGCLPFADPALVAAYLVDTDVIVKGNLATGLLSFPPDRGRNKTRVVAAMLERIGFRTRIVERRFDDWFRPTDDEPSLALCGFDDPTPRQLLGDAGFARVVDVGLGAGHSEYLDILVHTFPSDLDPRLVFRSPISDTRVLSKTYQDEVSRRIALGDGEGDATCGVRELAGLTVGAAFVGVVAGAIAIADVLRYLHGGLDLSVLSLDLRTPNSAKTAPNPAPEAFANVGFVKVRP